MKPDQFCSHVRTFQARLSRTYPCLFPCRACRCTDMRVCEWSTPTLLTEARWFPIVRNKVCTRILCRDLPPLNGVSGSR